MAKSKLFDENGNKLYRLYTDHGTTYFGGKPLELYDVKLSAEYAEILRRAKLRTNDPDGLGVTTDGKPFIPEHFHTPEMLADGLIAVAEDDGTLDTVNKDIAKSCMKQLWISPFFGRQTGKKLEKESPFDAESLRKLLESKLDKGSPQDIIDELIEEARRMKDPKLMQAQQAKEREKVAVKASKVKE